MNDDDKYFFELLTQCQGRMVGFLVGLIICFFITLLVSHRCSNGNTPQVLPPDTIIVRDTIMDSVPVPVHDTLLGYQKTKLIILHDTLKVDFNPDSLYAFEDSVIVPISQKEYTDDSTYRAWVSGYNTQLDSIQVYRQNMIITRREQLQAPRFNVSLGGGVGYGIFNRKPDLFIAITFGYRIDLFSKNKRESKQPPDE